MKNIAKKEDIVAFGRLQIQKFREGVLLQEVNTPNMIVSIGKQFIMERLISNIPTQINHMAIGSGTTAPVSTDSTLEAELSRLGIGMPLRNNTTVTFTGIFPAGNGTGTISEAGLFNALSGGTMLARTTFTPIEKGVDDTLAISWHIALS